MLLCPSSYTIGNLFRQLVPPNNLDLEITHGLARLATIDYRVSIGTTDKVGLQLVMQMFSTARQCPVREGKSPTRDPKYFLTDRTFCLVYFFFKFFLWIIKIELAKKKKNPDFVPYYFNVKRLPAVVTSFCQQPNCSLTPCDSEELKFAYIMPFIEHLIPLRAEA